MFIVWKVIKLSLNIISVQVASYLSFDDVMYIQIV